MPQRKPVLNYSTTPREHTAYRKLLTIVPLALLGLGGALLPFGGLQGRVDVTTIAVSSIAPVALFLSSILALWAIISGVSRELNSVILTIALGTGILWVHHLLSQIVIS